MITLRPYQQRCIDQVFDWFAANPAGNPVVSACVGAGKSIMIAEFVRHVMTTWPGQRILMAVHSRELVRQNAEKLKAIWPDAPLGIHSAGLGSWDCFDPIIFASIGSIWKKAQHVGRFDIMLVDECHAISTRNSGMYRRFIDDMLRINPKFRVIGWTGTPYRGNGVWLWEGEDPLFSGLAADVSMDEMLAGNYLVPLVNSDTQTTIDASGVKVDSRTGDYVVSQLAKLVDDADIIRQAVQEIVSKGQARRSWLVYCLTVQHAQHVRDEIRRHGIVCEMVTGETPKRERDRILDGFKAHRIRCVVNVAVLTTGFDHPATDLIALLRNTRSPVLMTQIAGRGMRTAPGKADCLFLDFTDSTGLLGPINRITGRSQPKASASGGEAAEAPTRQCPQCLDNGLVTRLHPSIRECDVCGYQFPETIGHDATTSDAVLIAKGPTVYPVSRVAYLVHRKPNKPDSLRVDYYSGLRRVASEWVCLEHHGYALDKAAHWWKSRVDPMFYDRLPNVAQAALLAPRYARTPTRIAVDESGRYPEIKQIEFAQEAAA